MRSEQGWRLNVISLAAGSFEKSERQASGD
jgi:hypothetical protein